MNNINNKTDEQILEMLTTEHYDKSIAVSLIRWVNNGKSIVAFQAEYGITDVMFDAWKKDNNKKEFQNAVNLAYLQEVTNIYKELDCADDSQSIKKASLKAQLLGYTPKVADKDFSSKRIQSNSISKKDVNLTGVPLDCE